MVGCCSTTASEYVRDHPFLPDVKAIAGDVPRNLLDEIADVILALNVVCARDALLSDKAGVSVGLCAVDERAACPRPLPLSPGVPGKQKNVFAASCERK
jgi:hypothetical protein